MTKLRVLFPFRSSFVQARNTILCTPSEHILPLISVAVLLLCRHFRPAGLSVSCRSQPASIQNVHAATAAYFTVEEILLSHVNLQRYSPSAHAVNQR